MYRKQILTTINIAHQFESAFSREELYQYLRFRIDQKTFHSEVDRLIEDDIIWEREGLLFLRDMRNSYRQRKKWSQALFKQNRKYLLFLSKMPWVKYISLTGANSFESCQEEDDIDLFIITAANRLWLCYLLLVVITKIMRKRETLCVNYLVDENNLEIREKNYFTAVQIIQMIPVYDHGSLHQQLIERNEWIFQLFPNANSNISVEQFYWLGNNGFSRNGRAYLPRFPAYKMDLLRSANNKIYRKYANRLQRKFPDVFGKAIILSEGLAKLNRIDNQDIYGDLFQEADEEAAP